MRAKMLLAVVYAQTGHGEQAISYAKEMQPYFLSIDTADWELAFVHGIYAHAASSAGLKDEHKQSYALAVKALENISDPLDKEIVEVTFSKVPKPA